MDDGLLLAQQYANTIISHLSLVCVIAGLRTAHSDLSVPDKYQSVPNKMLYFFLYNTWHCSEELDCISVTMEAKLSMGHRAVGHIGA